MGLDLVDEALQSLPEKPQHPITMDLAVKPPRGQPSALADSKAPFCSCPVRASFFFFCFSCFNIFLTLWFYNLRSASWFGPVSDFVPCWQWVL